MRSSESPHVASCRLSHESPAMPRGKSRQGSQHVTTHALLPAVDRGPPRMAERLRTACASPRSRPSRKPMPMAGAVRGTGPRSVISRWRSTRVPASWDIWRLDRTFWNHKDATISCLGVCRQQTAARSSPWWEYPKTLPNDRGRRFARGRVWT